MTALGHPNHTCTPDCFGCKVQSVQLDPYATPNRLHPEIAPDKESKVPRWERGLVQDSRGMPYLHDGATIPVKQWSENHHFYEDKLRERHQTGRVPKE